MRVSLFVALGLALSTRLAAQGSPYIPLDDPRLPAFEHLVAAGDVPDPSPFVRPFRRVDALRALDSALTAGTARDTALVAELRQAWREDTAAARWEVEGHAGGEAYSNGNLDPLHPAGPSKARPYVDLGLTAVFGNVVLASRPAIETRLLDDPNWPGRKNLSVTGREVEAYVSAQFRFASLYYGEMDQNWGPVGLPGIGVSNYGYPHPNLALQVGNGRFRLMAQASELADTTDSLGQVEHRYFFAHRIDARLTHRFNLGLWETVVIGGPDRNFDARYRNPVSLLLLTNQYGLGDTGNLLLGLDMSWRVGQRVTLQAQLGLDDIQYKNTSGPTRYPDRYAFTLMATGPLLDRMAWRAYYTQASSLVFRTSNPIENFTDQGIGL
ncbi:MAG TPA: capsule assembly Wzi family protein, partial [Gemmatimonadales bacterium]|nr:capsule assembly Wzi family protein [Gemmatimonadales bacterium]